MRKRYRPDHCRRHPRFGSPCLIAADPHLDNVCSNCGGAVPEVPLMMFGEAPGVHGDIDAWVYCDDCACEIMRRADLLWAAHTIALEEVEREPGDRPEPRRPEHFRRGRNR